MSRAAWAMEDAAAAVAEQDRLIMGVELSRRAGTVGPTGALSRPDRLKPVPADLSLCSPLASTAGEDAGHAARKAQRDGAAFQNEKPGVMPGFGSKFK